MKRWMDYWWDRLLRRKSWTYWRSESRTWVPERMTRVACCIYAGDPLYIWWNRPPVVESLSPTQPPGPPPHILEQIYGPAEPAEETTDQYDHPIRNLVGKPGRTCAGSGAKSIVKLNIVRGIHH